MGGEVMGEERRQSPRVQSYLPIHLVVLGEQRIIQTLTKDLGAGGARCLSPVFRPASCPVSVELCLEAGEHPLNLKAKIVWVKEVPQSDQYHLGLMFEDLSEENTKRLSSYLQKISSALAPAGL
ncbi:MAG: PilZ domain-containing protein [Candidatus Omnitrophica bacterium]|nr:PilZ domain-containing protein [Candidatus Omnitrophota bacterium]